MQRVGRTPSRLPQATTIETGLTTAEARKRLAEYGPNRLVAERRRPPLIEWLVRPFTDPMVLLLIAAGITYLFLLDYVDAAVVLVAAVPIALVSTILEVRAERALDRLKQLTAPTARVRRDGRRETIPAEEIVPGDLVFVQEGDIVPADGVLVAGSQVLVDESALTGESLSITKDAAGPDRDLYAGTTILNGRGLMQVVETGPRTRFGQIGTLVARIRQPPTPLQRLINRLVWQSTIVAAVFCVAVAAIELSYGRGWAAAITAGVSLAIAALPEEFSIVYSLYLTLGAWRLARERALVRRLASVETLGATTVICTDKTGTLTLGRLDVANLATDGKLAAATEPLDPRTRQLVEAAVLASEPRPFDPLDQAIVRFATGKGIDVAALFDHRLVRDYPFDPLLKYVTHVWKLDSEYRICAKGATEGILERSRVSADAREQAARANQTLASQGLRVIAVAEGRLTRTEGDRVADECGLEFVGLVAFADPLRPGVCESLAECHDAGIRVIMVTGDHPVTAHAVAEGLKLPHRDHVATGSELDAASDADLIRLVEDVDIFARIRPEQKYRLVRTLKAENQVVAMTGDGINDAPALREANIGVAMGQRGTEVSREVADIILLDDNFSTIVVAVRDGRRIFENLRRAFAYLIAFETPLLLGALVIPLIGVPLLLLPPILIWSELIVHPTASLVFENDPAPADLMRRPPRPPGTGLLVTGDFIRSLAQGSLLAGGVLVLYLALLAHAKPVPEARAAALAALLLGQLIVLLSSRSPFQPFWRISLLVNPVLPWVIGVTVASLLVALYVPPIAAIVGVAPPTPGEWLLAIVTALVTSAVLEPLKSWQRASTAPP